MSDGLLQAHSSIFRAPAFATRRICFYYNGTYYAEALQGGYPNDFLASFVKEIQDNEHGGGLSEYDEKTSKMTLKAE